jgi:hypothetical protein
MLKHQKTLMSNCDVRKSKNKIFSDRLKRQIRLDIQDNRFRASTLVNPLGL